MRIASEYWHPGARLSFPFSWMHCALQWMSWWNYPQLLLVAILQYYRQRWRYSTLALQRFFLCFLFPIVYAIYSFIFQLHDYNWFLLIHLFSPELDINICFLLNRKQSWVHSLPVTSLPKQVEQVTLHLNGWLSLTLVLWL